MFCCRVYCARTKGPTKEAIKRMYIRAEGVPLRIYKASCVYNNKNEKTKLR